MKKLLWVVLMVVSAGCAPFQGTSSVHRYEGPFELIYQAVIASLQSHDFEITGTNPQVGMISGSLKKDDLEQNVSIFVEVIDEQTMEVKVMTNRSYRREGTKEEPLLQQIDPDQGVSSRAILDAIEPQLQRLQLDVL